MKRFEHLSFRILTTIFLLFSIAFVVVPAEFIHHFFHHAETEDEYFSGHLKVIEKQHVHCYILKVEIPEYFVESQKFYQRNYLYPKSLISHYRNPEYRLFARNIDNRGPPSLL